MRALALTMTLACAVAHAAPPKYTHTASTSTDPAVALAERRWSAAEREPDPRSAAALWEEASAAFVTIVDAGTLPRTELESAARAAVAAIKNALDVDPQIKPVGRTVDYDAKPAPRAIPAREQRMLHVLEVGARYATPDEDAQLKFLRGNLYRRYDHFDRAIPIFLDVLANHRTHEVAEYAANLLLDAYNLLQRYDELVALADKLRADKTFLANKPELARTVGQIHRQAQTLVVRRVEQAARETKRPELYDQCAELYLSLVEDYGDHGDETLYNAMVCFEAAGSVDRALAAARRLAKEFPRSRLRMRAQVRTITMHANAGRFADAAAIAEDLLPKYEERDREELLAELVRWQVALGQLDRAARNLERFGKTPPRRGREIVASLTVYVAHHFLAAGKRAVAARMLRSASIAPAFGADVATHVDFASRLADAACPVAPVDGLCPRPRDPILVARARREIGVAADATHPFTPTAEPDAASMDVAELLLTDLDLEAILAKRPPTANHPSLAGPTTAASLAEDYTNLATSTSPWVRVAARWRLAQLARHARDATEQRVQLEACIVEARTALTGESWLAVCERELARLGGPVDRVVERLPATSAPSVIVLEVPR